MEMKMKAEKVAESHDLKYDLLQCIKIQLLDWLYSFYIIRVCILE